MRRLSMLLTGLVALSACSESRERQLSSVDTAAGPADLTLPDTVTRADTTITLSSQSEAQVPSMERKAAPRPSQTSRPAKSPKRRAKPADRPRAVPQSTDTAVQGYAPTQIGDTTARDTATPSPEPVRPRQSDTVPSPRSDSVVVPRSDTVAAQAGDTITQIETAGEITDTALPTPRGAAKSPQVDTAAQIDTLSSAADTASTASADTMVASPSRNDVAARTLPIGTEIHASLNDSITSRRDTAGQIVSAHVMQNVKGPDGRTLIAAGTRVQFTVTRIRPARSKNSQGRLALDVNGFEVEGQLVPVQAEVRPVPRELRGRGVGGSEVAKVGGGAAAGAVLGRVIGGNTRGAVIGGVAGAAAGAVVADQTATRDVVVKAKTPVVFVLTAPLVAP
jgi:hypothetical protein